MNAEPVPLIFVHKLMALLLHQKGSHNSAIQKKAHRSFHNHKSLKLNQFFIDEKPVLENNIVVSFSFQLQLKTLTFKTRLYNLKRKEMFWCKYMVMGNTIDNHQISGCKQQSEDLCPSGQGPLL